MKERLMDALENVIESVAEHMTPGVIYKISDIMMVEVLPRDFGVKATDENSIKFYAVKQNGNAYPIAYERNLPLLKTLAGYMMDYIHVLVKPSFEEQVEAGKCLLPKKEVD